jgi:hypothetical protein
MKDDINDIPYGLFAVCSSRNCSDRRRSGNCDQQNALGEPLRRIPIENQHDHRIDRALHHHRRGLSPIPRHAQSRMCHSLVQCHRHSKILENAIRTGVLLGSAALSVSANRSPFSSSSRRRTNAIGNSYGDDVAYGAPCAAHVVEIT